MDKRLPFLPPVSAVPKNTRRHRARPAERQRSRSSIFQTAPDKRPAKGIKERKQRYPHGQPVAPAEVSPPLLPRSPRTGHFQGCPLFLPPSFSRPGSYIFPPAIPTAPPCSPGS